MDNQENVDNSDDVEDLTEPTIDELHKQVLQKLEDKKDYLVSRRERERKRSDRGFYVVVTSISILPIVAYFSRFEMFRPIASEDWLARILPILTFYIVFGLGLIARSRSQLRSIDQDIQDLDFETDLQRYAVSKRESRAEKLLRLNQVQLKRYYDLNLSQNTWIFLLGLFCILLGVAVIGITLYLVTRVATTDNEKIIIAVIGGIGSLLTNFVAAIFIKMHSAAVSSLNAFHSKLVNTQELFVINFLVAKIYDKQKRWNTLSALSLELAENPEKAKAADKDGGTAKFLKGLFKKDSDDSA